VERNALFQFSIDNVLEIILIFDENGTIVYSNKTAQQQLEYKEQLCGLKITEIFPGEFSMENDRLVFQTDVDGTVRNMMAYRGNRTCFPADMKLFSYDVSQWSSVDVHKERRLFICTGYDASNRQFLEKQVSNAGKEAEDALRVKSEFVANVTHELRTPVNGILGNTQELINRENDNDKLRLLHMVERGCKDMHALINNILDFSKLEAGKFILEPRQFHFRDMIDYVKGNHSNRIIEKGLDFSITVSPEIPECIIGDELRIVQILNNLISNAYKFTSVGSIHVEILKTAQAGNRAELFFLVMDTGIGIAKADQDKLFKSFSQVDASISRKYGGTGLGLNICKQLVELMGGNIHVESNAGKGSVFSFHVWVEIPEECNTSMIEANTEEKGMFADAMQQAAGQTNSEEQSILHKLQSLTEGQISDKIWKYGETENKEEIEKKMSKLILCVEMENWEKAEMFAETVKQLVEEAPREVKSAALRMKMAVQKGDYEKATAAFEILQNLI